MPAEERITHLTIGLPYREPVKRDEPKQEKGRVKTKEGKDHYTI